jgi:nucleoside-diphosphate-sugar epimerase
MDPSMTIHIFVVGRGVSTLSLLRIFGTNKATTTTCASGAEPNLGTRFCITLGTTCVGYYPDVGRISRFVDRVITIPRPDRDLESHQKCICNYVLSQPRSQNIILLPVATEEAIFLSQIADELRNTFRTAGFLKAPTIWVSSYEVLSDLYHPFRFQKRMAHVFTSSKQPLPFSAHVQNSEHLMQAIDKCFEKHSMLLRVVVKPCMTRGGQGMQLISREEWMDVQHDEDRKRFQRRFDFSNHSEYCVQEYVEGHEISSFSLCANGKVLAHVCYQPRFFSDSLSAFASIRDLMSTKSSRYRRSLEYVRLVASSLHLNGMFVFDYIERFDGRLVALACNSNPQAINGGLALFSPRFDNFAAHQLNFSFIREISLENATKRDCTVDPPHSVVSPTCPCRLMTVLPTLFYLGKLWSTTPQDGYTFGVLLEIASVAYDDVWWWRDPLPWFCSLLRFMVLVTYSCVRIVIGGKISIIDIFKDSILDEFDAFSLSEAFQCHTGNESWDWIGGEDMSESSPSNTETPDVAGLNVLVTGATGFLGGRLVQVLHNGFFEENSSLHLPFPLDSIRNIIATGRNEQKGKQLIESLNANDGKTRFVKADLCDVEQTYALIKGRHVVFHCAALCAPWGRWDDFISANMIASQNVAHACCLVETVQLLVYISSPSICMPVDAREQLNIKETDPLPRQEKQPMRYAATKKIAEEIVLDVCKRFALPCVVLRPRAIFGPGDSTLMPLVIDRLTRGRLPIIGRNDCIGDFTYVDNVVYACICCLSSNFKSPKIFAITNDDPQFLWKTVIRMICDKLKLQYPSKRLPRSLAYMVGYVCECFAALALLFGHIKEPILTRYSVNVLSQSCTLDISAAKEELHYKPIFSFEESIRKYIEAFEMTNM